MDDFNLNDSGSAESESSKRNFNDLVAEKRLARGFKYFSFYFAGFFSLVFLVYSLYLICTFISLTKIGVEAQMTPEAEVAATESRKVAPAAIEKTSLDPPLQSSAKVLTIRHALPYFAGFTLLTASIGLTIAIALLKYAFYSDQSARGTVPSTPAARAVADFISEFVNLVKGKGGG